MGQSEPGSNGNVVGTPHSPELSVIYSIVVYAFACHVSMSVSVDETLLPR